MHGCARRREIPRDTAEALTRSMHASELPDLDLHTRTLERIDQVEPAAWNQLAGAEQPFLRHEFLSALEHQRCVGGDTGWLPRHLIVQDGHHRLVGAMPLYVKEHSW